MFKKIQLAGRPLILRIQKPEETSEETPDTSIASPTPSTPTSVTNNPASWYVPALWLDRTRQANHELQQMQAELLEQKQALSNPTPHNHLCGVRSRID